MQNLGVQAESLQETYLGMPTEVGRSPVRTFKYLINRMWQRMSGCSDRPLSRAGAETFLKSIIQAIPTYVMSCFQLPISTCDSMRQAIANQWWGTKDGKKKLHWRSWEWLSTPKNLGGLGFRDLGLFNQSMLGRQCWRLLTDPSSLCARVLKGRYFPDCDFWDAPKPRSSSYTCRSIQFGMQLLKDGVRWGISDGKKTKILTDKWIPDVPPYTLRPLVPLMLGQTVDTLMMNDSNEWDAELIRTVFDEEVDVKILQVSISHHGGEDFASWPWTRFGNCTVRSAYHLARSERVAVDRSKHGQGSSSVVSDNSRIWKKLWASKAPGKMKITLWRFAHDCLPCGHQLQKRHIPAATTCIYCNKHETVEHALLFCPFADEVWREVKSDFSIHLHRKTFTSRRVWALDFIDRCSELEATTLMVTLWHIWDARNKCREGEGMMHPKSLAAKIKAYIDMICIHLYKPMTADRRESYSSTPKWVPPPAGIVLVNVDAATFANTR
jgi:hypothetical protein